jgi:hypothetical protein
MPHKFGANASILVLMPHKFGANASIFFLNYILRKTERTPGEPTLQKKIKFNSIGIVALFNGI